MELLTQDYIQILLLLAFCIPAIFFILTQQRILALVRPENRRMIPGLVWLQVIPLLGLLWQFIVVKRVSDSIRNELNSPTNDSIFVDTPIPQNFKPTYNTGVSYCTLFCLSILPTMLKFPFAIVGIGLWIKYWTELSSYKKQLKERVLLLN